MLVGRGITSRGLIFVSEKMSGLRYRSETQGWVRIFCVTAVQISKTFFKKDTQERLTFVPGYLGPGRGGVDLVAQRSTFQDRETCSEAPPNRFDPVPSNAVVKNRDLHGSDCCLTP